MAFRGPISGARGRRAQRACEQEAECPGPRTPHGIHPPLGGPGQSDRWQKRRRRNGTDPPESQQYGCDRSRLVWSCRQMSTRSHHACPRRTTPISCDVRRQVVKGPLHGASWIAKVLRARGGNCGTPVRSGEHRRDAGQPSPIAAMAAFANPGQICIADARLPVKGSVPRRSIRFDRDRTMRSEQRAAR